MSREKLMLDPRALLGKSINDATADALVHGFTLHVVMTDDVEVPVTEANLPDRRFNVEVKNGIVWGINFDIAKFRL